MQLWSRYGLTSASLLACEDDFRVALGSLFVYNGDFVATLGSLGGRFWNLRVCGHFGVALGALAAYVQRKIYGI